MRTLINPSDWVEPNFQHHLQAMKLPFGNHRKVWELVSIAQLIEQRGLLNGKSVGLGLGVGTEHLCYYFANLVGEVIATDLFQQETKWDCARLDPEAAYAANPFPYARERLKFRHMDMTKIDLPDASVDFVWSTSSVEHVDSVDAYLETFRGVARVLKPGGVAAIVTEFNLRPGQDYRPGLILVDVPLLRRVEEATGLRVAGPLDLSVDDHPYLVPFNLEVLDQTPEWRHIPNIWAFTGDALFTSARVVFEKAKPEGPVQVSRDVDPELVRRYDEIGARMRQVHVRRFRPEARYTQVGTLSEHGGKPLMRTQAGGKEGYLAFGPYVLLSAGRYRALFDLHVEGEPPRKALVDVAATVPGQAEKVLQSAPVAGRPRAGGSLTVSVEFEAMPGAAHELRVWVPAKEYLGYAGCRLVPEP